VVERTLEQQVEGERAVGARAMLKLARRWGRTPVRAAALVRRVDVVQFAAFVTGGGPFGEWLTLDKDLRQKIEGASLELPAAMLLVLGERNRIHLVALRDGPIFLKAKDEVMSWAANEVEISIKPGRKKNLRLVEIAYGETKLLVAGAWRKAPQRAALELIEETSRHH
jgi:hypothetical protein